MSVRKAIIDKSIREKVNQMEKNTNLSKCLAYSEKVGNKTKFNILLKLSKKKSSKAKIKNRCLITYRVRSTLSKFKVSRIMFKKLASSGLIKNLKKE